MLKATNYVIFFILIYLFSTVAAVFKLFISWPFSFFFFLLLTRVCKSYTENRKLIPQYEKQKIFDWK